MHRLPLVLAGAMLCAVLVFSGTAAAKPTKTCSTHSKYVVGHQVKGKLIAKNVNKAQKQYASCGYAKKVMNRTIIQGVEEPKVVAGFRCKPTVAANNNNRVKYRCLFRSADRPMEVVLHFQVTYKS